MQESLERWKDDIMCPSKQLTLCIDIHSDAGTDEVDEEGAAEKADQADVDRLAVVVLESVEAAEVGAGLVAK